MTFLISKREIFVYNAGSSELKFLSKFGLRDYIKYDNKPYGELEPETFWSSDCLYLRNNCKFLLMSDGLSRSIDRVGVAERFYTKTEELADLIFQKAVREGRYEPSLACVEYEAA